MEIPFNIPLYLEEEVLNCANKIPEFSNNFASQVRIAEPKFGDFQANGVLPFAKKYKLNPRELATKLVDSLNQKFDPNYILVSIAGPGFINFKLSAEFLFQWAKKFNTKSDFQKAAEHLYHGKTISIDYSSPNTAKQMHVGHLRSMIIGEAIQRMLRFCGANVIRDNHIGDWGTQFGILIMAIKEFSYDLHADHGDPLTDLEDLYKRGNVLFKESEANQEKARAELLKLQQGDEENHSIWKIISKISYAAFEEIYKLMNIEFDVVLGESFYRNKVDRVYKELERSRIAEESEGALVVFLPSNHKGDEQFPYIIRKRDGASNYAATDLATIQYHTEETKVNEMIYVTDARQQDHFKYLFHVAKLWFEAENRNLPNFKHVWFGSILGEDGKAIKTRSGDPIKLKELLKEGIDRAHKIVSAKNPSLSEDEKKKIAKVVGLGAIRYADLVQNRTTDYMFSWDKILAFEGNTAPYLLYAVARIYSIFRKLELSPNEVNSNASCWESENELALARKLTMFPVILEQAISELRPHVICGYIYELAGVFSTFYNAEKVIVNEEDIRARRLLLCGRTLHILETGLHLLGLETLERM